MHLSIFLLLRLFFLNVILQLCFIDVHYLVEMTIFLYIEFVYLFLFKIYCLNIAFLPYF